MYRLGLGTAVDMKRAMDLYERAAQLDDPKAKFTLGNLHATGINDANYQLQVNPSKAFNLWYEAANLAQRPAGFDGRVVDADVASRSFYNLGNCYFLGLGLPDCDAEAGEYRTAPQFAVAVEFWELAAKLDAKNLRAWLQLGNTYYDGLTYGGKNFERALYFYEQILSQQVGGGNNHIDAETIAMAESLATLCRTQLGLNQSTDNTNSTQVKSESYKQMIQDARAGAKFQGAFTRSADLADFEKERVKSLESLIDVQRAQEDALRHKWKYVEDFGSTMTTAVPTGPAQKDQSTNSQKCTIM